MFWSRLLELCNKKGTSPTAVVKLLNIGAGSVTKWKNGTTPRGTTLLKLCDYFGVSVDYLLGKEDEKKPTDDGELSDVESTLLELFRTLPEESQRMYLEVLRATLKKQ